MRVLPWQRSKAAAVQTSEIARSDTAAELPAVLFAALLAGTCLVTAEFGLLPSTVGKSETPVRTADAALPVAADFNAFFAQRIQLR